MEQKEEIRHIVIALVVKLTNYEGIITGETRLSHDLGMDSMDRSALYLLVEESFDVELDPRWRNWRTVDDVVGTVMDIRNGDGDPSRCHPGGFHNPASNVPAAPKA